MPLLMEIKKEDMAMGRKSKILINLAVSISLFCAVFIVPAYGGTDFCNATSQTMWLSCSPTAQGDYGVAQAKCTNISDPVKRNNCLLQAQTDKLDTLNTCIDQYFARQAACKRLGSGRYDPVINPANFVATIDNPLFPLNPGTTFIYEGDTEAGFEHDEFFVTHKTKVILGVTCVEVRDTAKVNGKLVEDTLDWFAQDKDGNVWYFGENAKQLEGGLVVGVEGSWTGGVDNAKPGIVMKAHPAIGNFYRQEFSLGTAEDIAEVISLNNSVNVTYGSFTHCLKTKETAPLEPDTLEFKFYCPGVGNVLTKDISAGETLQLVDIKTE
jgi:hypothetical protein